jgi:cell division protein FtsB
MKLKIPFSFKSFGFPFLSLILVLYFTYHVFQGDRGVIALLRIQKVVADLEREHDVLQKQKEQLEKNVYLLRPDSLDTDLLEERGRAVLNYAHPSEVVIKNNSVGHKGAA